MDKNLKTALKTGGISIGVIIILSVIPGLLYGWQGYGYSMMGPGMMGGFGTMFFMPILWIVILGIIIWVIVASVRSSRESTGSGSLKAGSALELLKTRYARGEIDKQEYEEKQKDLV